MGVRSCHHVIRSGLHSTNSKVEPLSYCKPCPLARSPTGLKKGELANIRRTKFTLGERIEVRPEVSDADGISTTPFSTQNSVADGLTNGCISRLDYGKVALCMLTTSLFINGEITRQEFANCTVEKYQ